ncbi:MAG: pyruvate kinase [Candidatus Methylomirabilota bacterium]
MAKDTKIIITIPPFAKFGEVSESPLVEGVRFNTTLPLDESPEEVLSTIKKEANGKDVWIDLKCRQLRITSHVVEIAREQEIHCIDLNHKIKVNLPADVMADNGNYRAKISSIINGNRLIIPSSNEKGEGFPLANSGKVGMRPGMSITILDPSLEIQGYLTEKDKGYVEAAKNIGLHNYMLSFVEKEQDIEDMLALDDKAKIVAKIESKKGLEFVANSYPKYAKKISLMAARGDMYLELDRPEDMASACSAIIKQDKNAMIASRMLESLMKGGNPDNQDIFDIYCGMLMGYRRFMLGDDVCRCKESSRNAIEIIGNLAEKYKQENGKNIFHNGK